MRWRTKDCLYLDAGSNFALDCGHVSLLVKNAAKSSEVNDILVRLAAESINYALVSPDSPH